MNIQSFRRYTIEMLTFLTLITIVSCGKTGQTSQEEPLEAKVLTVCELVDNLPQFETKRVKVKAKLRGFHQLVLSSNECPGPDYLILTDLSYSMFASYRENLRPDKSQANEISGNAIVEGVVRGGAGYLTNYGDFVSNTHSNQVIQKPKDLVVSTLVETKLIHFVPSTSGPGGDGVDGLDKLCKRHDEEMERFALGQMPPGASKTPFDLRFIRDTFFASVRFRLTDIAFGSRFRSGEVYRAFIPISFGIRVGIREIRR